MNIGMNMEYCPAKIKNKLLSPQTMCDEEKYLNFALLTNLLFITMWLNECSLSELLLRTYVYFVEEISDFFKVNVITSASRTNRAFLCVLCFNGVVVTIILPPCA